MKFRIIVCGGRDYVDAAKVHKVLSNLLQRHGSSLEIIQGGARGADRLARQWADSNGVSCLTMKADWDRFGPSAGPIRNKNMAIELMKGVPRAEFEKSRLVVAFPGGPGTANMMGVAHAYGLKVLEVK